MIALSEGEEKLFRVLLGSRDRQGRRTVLRVAGGWVRDKILGRESDDVDIALDDQSGVEFASSLNEFLRSEGYETHKLAVITANPDQSKHIETAVVRVLGFSIDFVNLRSESYTEASRIPTIRFGSPVEDAQRRDFTVNALFYNMDTRNVEDYTNRGLADLEAGIIRTPVDPLITFRDDPLRVLRAIRFSSRYAFSFDDALVHAARHVDIHHAMTHKVSRERVWKELKPMICNDVNPAVRPLLAIASLFYFGIFGIVFSIPDLESNAISIEENRSTMKISGTLENSHVFATSGPEAVTQAMESWQAKSFETSVWYGALLARRRMLTFPSGKGNSCHVDGKEAGGKDMEMDVEEDWDGDEGGLPATTVSVRELVALTPELAQSAPSRVFYLAAALSGLHSLQTMEKKRNVKLSALMLRDSLKVDTDTLRATQALLDATPSLQRFKDALQVVGGAAKVAREEVGLLLRTLRGMWRETVWFACSAELAANAKPDSSLHSKGLAHINSTSSGGNDDVGSERCHRWASILFDITIEESTREIIESYAALEVHIISLGLDGCWDLKPLLDGNRLMKEIPNLKKGPQVGKIMDAQLRWQLRNGPGGTIEECKAFLNSYLLDINTSS